MKTSHITLGTAIAMLSCICAAAKDTNSLPPKEYSALHILASDPKDPKWADSMRQLAKVGDAFTLEHLKTLDVQKLDASQTQILKETI